MSNKPTQQRPVARPTIAPTPKLSARDRRALKNQPTKLEASEQDSPKVKAAKRVLDQMSESLAPEGALLPAPSTPLRMDSEPSKVCSYHKRPEPLTAFASNAAHADHLQSACREAEKIRRDARKAKAAK
jgi:hypothetical protein